MCGSFDATTINFLKRTLSYMILALLRLCWSYFFPLFFQI